MASSCRSGDSEYGMMALIGERGVNGTRVGENKFTSRCNVAETSINWCVRACFCDSCSKVDA